MEVVIEDDFEKEKISHEYYSEAWRENKVPGKYEAGSNRVRWI